MPLSQVAEVAIVTLRPDAQLIGYLRGGIGSEVGERPAALAGVHGEPVVVVGVDESL